MCILIYKYKLQTATKINALYEISSEYMKFSKLNGMGRFMCSKWNVQLNLHPRYIKFYKFSSTANFRKVIGERFGPEVDRHIIQHGN